MPGGEFAVWVQFEAVVAAVTEEVVTSAAVTDVLAASMCTGKGWYG